MWLIECKDGVFESVFGFKAVLHNKYHRCKSFLETQAVVSELSMADMDFPGQVGSRGAGTCKVNATSTEAARRLLAAYKQLEFTQPPPVVGGIEAATTMEQQDLWARVELRPAACQRRVKTFLSEIESTAQALELPMASRRYRQGFTRNYRALMPADRRVYRVDVLEAGQEAHNVLWVNGIRYVLPDKVLAANLKFRTAWTTLLREISLLSSEYSAAADDVVISSTPNASRKFDWLTRLGFPLIRFDFCWTEFERNYIEALMAIEQEARSTLMDCLYVDEELRQYEKLYYRIASSKTNGGSEADDVDASLVNLSSTICDCYTRLVYHVGQLNSCANTRRKGRSDFRFSVIDTATRAVCLTESVTKAELDDSSEQASFYAPFSHRYPWATYRCTDNTDHWIYTAEPDEVETLRPLAEPLIRDIEALRNVFASLAQSPERIDPHLAQNASLAEALAQFESRWDDVSVYLDKPCVLRSLTTFLAFLQLVLRLDKDNYGPKSRDNLKQTSGSTKNASPRAKEKQYLKQGKTDVTRPTLEDRIACLDVSAFLALSRLAVLFSVLSSSYVAEDKRAEFPHASLLKHLLPDTFEALMHDAQLSANNPDGNCLIESSERECCAASKSSNPETATLPPYSPWLFPMARPLEVESREGVLQVLSYFVARTPVTQDIPPVLDNVLYWGSRFSSFFTQSHIDPVLAAKAQTRALLHIFERCVKQGDEADGDSDEQYVTKLPLTGGLDETVLRFVHALKESSMTLQRTNPKEWNAFIQTSLKCLQSFRLVCPLYNLQRSHSKTLYTTSTSTSASSPRFNVEEEVCSPRVSFHPPLAAATAASAPETPRSSVQPQTKLPWCMLEGSPAPPSAAFNRPPSNPFYFTPSASRNIPRTSS